MTLTLYPESFAICQLDKSSTLPTWALTSRFYALAKTDDELSIVCESTAVPQSIKADYDWRAFKLHGPFAFDEIGIVASFSNVLAEAKIGIFVISTFDTDYFLVKSSHLEAAIKALRSQHHSILEA